METVRRAKAYDAEIDELKYFLAQFQPKDQERFYKLFHIIDRYRQRLVVHKKQEDIDVNFIRNVLTGEKDTDATTIKIHPESHLESETESRSDNLLKRQCVEDIKSLLFTHASLPFVEGLRFTITERFTNGKVKNGKRYQAKDE